jgi:hypothetical protein
MMRGSKCVRVRGRPGWLGVIALAIAAAGCSTISSTTSSVTDRFTNLFGSSPSGTEQVKSTGPDPEQDCPTIDVRQGAATVQVMATAKDPNPGALRYQLSVSRAARECTIGGVQGRIILGPAGVSGQVDVPLRLAVVREGVDPKTIWTKFYKIPVVLPAGQSNVPFAYVEENLAFPVPPAGELEAYVVYIGFDQNMQAPPPAKKKKGRAKSR